MSPSVSAPEPARIAESRLTHSAELLIGREVELARLDEAWREHAQHVLIIRGIGGEGKTSLVAEWTKRLARHAHRAYDGADYFDWSFYSQGTRDQATASSDAFIAAALGFFGDEEGRALANSPASGRDKAERLLFYLRRKPALLVLDGLEPLQHPPGPLAGHLRDHAMACLLRGLARNNPGLCVVTTREAVATLDEFRASTAPEWELEHLSDDAGADLLRRLFEPERPKGVHQLRSTPEERREISRAVRGHALTLRLLGGYIHRALRDVRRWREVDFARADALHRTNPRDPAARYGHAFKTMEAYERWLESGGAHGARQLAVLRLLGLFDRPADEACLAALRSPPAIAGLTEPLIHLDEAEWNVVLAELEECALVTLPKADGSRRGIDAHPLLREYFGRRLRERQPEAHRAAHRRLYEHLCTTTREGERPTLEALQPLYQAVAHGCQAGLAQAARADVYIARILRGKEAYSTKKLGAFGADLGAVACFFEVRWSRVSPALTATARAWLLAAVAFSLRALGRLGEAREPMRAGLEMAIKQDDWQNASRAAGNLSELELTLGEVAGALRDAEQAVSYAERSGDGVLKMLMRTTLADARYQAGRRAEAEALFQEAERMQAERQPGYPLLYSLRGFRYCDLLLGEAERAAGAVLWAGTPLAVAGPGHAGPARPSASASGDPAEACRAVAARAAQTLEWATNANTSLLDIALEHLSLGRAALYAVVLAGPGAGGAGGPLPPAAATSSPPLDRESAARELEAAVAGLRSAGRQDYLSRALLSRAWQRALAGALTGADSAQVDLDEAEDIAARGPMPLFQADIRLYRARLFHAATPYPWPGGPRADLAEARRLIEKHGYGRRLGELEDAEAALGVAGKATGAL